MSGTGHILLALWIFISSTALCIGMFFVVRRLAFAYRPAFLVSVLGGLVPEFYFLTGVAVVFGYVSLMLSFW